MGPYPLCKECYMCAKLFPLSQRKRGDISQFSKFHSKLNINKA